MRSISSPVPTGTVDFVTTIAPGLRDILLTGKAAEATRRRVAGRPVYQAVVMDAPPTGRIARFRESTRDQRIGIAQQIEHRYQRKVAWGVTCGDSRQMFSTLSAPVMSATRPRSRS